MTVASTTSLTPMGPLPSRKDTASFTERTETLFAVQLPRLVDEVNAALIFNNRQAQSVLDQSVVAKDASVQAWAASMSPAETLPSISKSLHSGAVVKSFFYDTSRDSDGGAWRKRCADKSWYTEASNGLWLGQSATAATAWALVGAVAGSYFQNTADGKFYALGVSSPAATEVYRGNAREFPAQVAIIAEVARVIIYDLTQVGCPMWMVFVSGSGFEYLVDSHFVSSVFAINAKLLVPGNSANDGVIAIDFIADNGLQYRSAADGCRTVNRNIAGRNSGCTWIAAGSLGSIVNSIVNDIATTVLDGAPIDPATGLPIPTIYAFTAGGVSRIAHDGTVSSTASLPVVSGAVIGDYVRAVGASVASTWPVSDVIPSPGNVVNGVNLFWTKATYTYNTLMATLGPISKAVRGALSGNEGLTVIKENFAIPMAGMVAKVNAAYNTGWQVGDSRGCWLADTVSETITSTELITNGAFSTDTNGWSSKTTAAGTAAVASGEMQVTATVAYGGMITAFPTVIGKMYRITGSSRLISGGGFVDIERTSFSGSNIQSLSINSTSTAIITSASFIATGTTSYVSVRCSIAGSVGGFDNISVKLVDADRSVKNNGLVVNGSLTKSAVAAGSQLVAYSGFSGTNYLEQAYSPNLDFGTGDFCVMGWLNSASYGVATYIELGSSGSSNRLAVTNVGGQLRLFVGGSYRVLATVSLTGLVHIVASRVSGVGYIYVNGVLIASAAAADSTSYAGGTLRCGVSQVNADAYPGSMALWRISATAPSADQLVHIYRTELALFQPGAKCTLDGTSNAVTALEYDDVTDVLHAGTSWGRSAFRDLLRIESEISTVGAITSLAAHQGAIITGGASSGRYYQPAMLLRDELRRKDEARQALGKIPVYVQDVGVTSKTAFTMQLGYQVVAVYAAGLLKDVGATLDYTLSFDGFRWTVNFAVAPANGARLNFVLVRTV